MKDFAKGLKTEVLDNFESIALKIVKEKTKKDKNDLPDNFLKQIRNHFQVHWVSLPFDENNYQEQFSEIEASLGAIKNIREFEQVEETGRKCSLCGERNLLFCAEGNKIKLQLKPNWKVLNKIDSSKIEDFNNSIIEIREPFDSSEGLCAICFTKRFYKEDNFPSTAKIALMDTITSLEKNANAKAKIQGYKKEFSDFDDQLFFEENLNTKYFEKQFIKADLNRATGKFNQVKDEIKNAKLKLSPYYAVIMFDGDSMGKWLSGLNNKETASLYVFHTKLSEALGKFSVKAREIVKEPKGRVVFAGGEDFLAFVNLNNLFAVLKELRDEFDKIVNQPLNEFVEDGANQFSFSAGIVIAHYKMPLAEVLKWARTLEKEAKNYDPNKNAFAIAVLKHSGEIVKTTHRWGDETSLTKNLDTISDISLAIAKDEFSNSFAKKLSAEFLITNDHSGLSVSSEILTAELGRLMKRAHKLKGKERDSKIDTMVQNLLSLYKNLNIENFLSSLHVAEFISRSLNGGSNEN